MDRKEFAARELDKNKKYQEKHDKLRDAYVEYINTGSHEAMDAIVALAMELHIAWAYSRTHDIDEAQDIIVIGAFKVHHGIEKKYKDPNQTPVAPDRISGYVHKIYEYTLIDYIRKKKKGKQKDALPDVSLDDIPGALETAKQAMTKYLEEVGDDPFQAVSAKERAQLFHDLLIEYCRALMNYERTDPPHALALYFARIIPHQLEEISYDVATSSKWAWMCMREHTFECLTKFSERNIRKYVSPKLAWCDEYKRKLNAPCKKVLPTKPLKQVMASAIMTERNIGHWSSELHKTISKRMFKKIRYNSDLAARAKAYIEDADPTFGALLYGGEKK